MSKRLNLPSNFFIAWWTHHSSFPKGDPTLKLRRGHPQQGRQIEVGIQKFAIFNQYFSVSGKWCDRSKVHFEMLIRNHKRSIEPWHSRWPWVTFEGHFSDSLSIFLVYAYLSISLKRMKLRIWNLVGRYTVNMQTRDAFRTRSGRVGKNTSYVQFVNAYVYVNWLWRLSVNTGVQLTLVCCKRSI